MDNGTLTLGDIDRVLNHNRRTIAGLSMHERVMALVDNPGQLYVAVGRHPGIDLERFEVTDEEIDHADRYIAEVCAYFASRKPGPDLCWARQAEGICADCLEPIEYGIYCEDCKDLGWGMTDRSRTLDAAVRCK